MADTENDKAIPYKDLIPSPEYFTGEKFREVLQSHGLTVTSGGNDTRLIKLDAHGEYPDIYINVPFAGHNFDKYVFSEAAEGFPVISIPDRPIERRLQYLNSILANSGYVGEKITLDMLNSREPLNLAPGYIAVLELEQFKENEITGIHSAEFFFNNPNGEQERLKHVEQRSLQSMQVAEEALMEYRGINLRKVTGTAPVTREQPHTSISQNVESTMRITAVIGGRRINLSLNAQEQQKLMALDDRQRIKLLDKMFPDAQIGKISRENKAELQRVVSDKLFGNPAIFISHIADTNKHEQQFMPKTVPMVSPSAMASANYDAEISRSEGQSQEISGGLGR